MKLTGLKLVAGALAVAALLIGLPAVLINQPLFEKMFNDFGGELPWVTRVFLNTPAVVAIALTPAVLVGLSLRVARTEAVQQVLLALASLTSFMLPLGFVVSLFLPLFAVSGKVG